MSREKHVIEKLALSFGGSALFPDYQVD